MATPPARSPVQVSTRLYQRLLALYPARYRSEYGVEMAQLFRDLAREAYGQARGWGLAGLWVRVLADTGRTAGEEHWLAFEESRRQACRVDVSWMRTGWPALLLATLLIVAGMAAKTLVLHQTQSAAAAAGVLVGALLLAVVLLDRWLHSRGQLLAPGAVVVISLMLPLAWVPDPLAWLQDNPLMAYTVIMVPFGWQPGQRAGGSLWATTLIYAATNLIIAFLVGP